MRCVLTACALLIVQGSFGPIAAEELPDAPTPSALPSLPAPVVPPPPPEFPPPTPPEDGPELPQPSEIISAPDFGPQGGFTRNSTGFDFPFCNGMSFGSSSLTGWRVLPPGFDPHAVERFPAFDQVGPRSSISLNAGLTYRTDRFGSLSFGYRATYSGDNVAFVTLGGPVDPLVINFLNDSASNSSDGDATRPRIIVVPDEVGSCLASSQTTIQQLDLAWSTPPLWRDEQWNIFAQIGVRAASFIHEDTTTSVSIFQQAKDRFSGVGPVGGIGLSYLLSQCQIYCLIDSGEMFGTAGQFDRELAILKHGAHIVSDRISRAENVTMLGVQAGIIIYSSDRLSVGLGYRFDQWWNLVRLRGGVVNWTNNAFDLQLRWRL